MLCYNKIPSRLIIISLAVAVLFVGRCRADGIFGSLFYPSSIREAAVEVLSNINIPFLNPKHKVLYSDNAFGHSFDAPGKKYVVLAFKKDFDVNTGKGGVVCFSDEFLDSIADRHRDAEVLKIMMEYCPETAAKYGLINPEPSENIYFAIDFRLKANDYINPDTLNIVTDLLNASNPNRKEMTAEQLQESIKAMRNEALVNGYKIPNQVELYWKSLMPEPELTHITMTESKGPATIQRVMSISDNNGIGILGEKITIAIEVNNDIDLDKALENKSQELIVLFYTNNDKDNEADSYVRMFLGMLLGVQTGLKIIQVNVNQGDCSLSMALYHVYEVPTLLFMKRGRMQISRVVGFDLDQVEAEISVLLSNIELIDTDLEFVLRLNQRENELIIVSFTNNSLTSDDIRMKMYLAYLSNCRSGIKVVQVNCNSGMLNAAIYGNNIYSVPTLLFSRRNQMLMAQVHGFNAMAIDAEISTMESLSEIVNDHDELRIAIKNAGSQNIVMFVTDNSLSTCDCAMKEDISNMSKSVDDVKVIQVNANTKKLDLFKNEFGLRTYPVVMFMKHGRLQHTRLYECNTIALEAELSILLSPIKTVDDDRELDFEINHLTRVPNVILYFTFNSFDKTDSLLKKFLKDLSTKTSNIKFIQVNTDSLNFPKTVEKHSVQFYPSLAFYRYGELKQPLLVGFDKKEILASIASFFYVNNDDSNSNNNKKPESIKKGEFVKVEKTTKNLAQPNSRIRR